MILKHEIFIIKYTIYVSLNLHLNTYSKVFSAAIVFIKARAHISKFALNCINNLFVPFVHILKFFYNKQVDSVCPWITKRRFRTTPTNLPLPASNSNSVHFLGTILLNCVHHKSKSGHVSSDPPPPDPPLSRSLAFTLWPYLAGQRTLMAFDINPTLV